MSRHNPSRHIAVEWGCSAELATPAGAAVLADAARALLARLGPDDRVTIRWPDQAGLPPQTLPRGEAERILRSPVFLPVPRVELTWTVDETELQTVRIEAGGGEEQSPDPLRLSRIVLPTPGLAGALRAVAAEPVESSGVRLLVVADPAFPPDATRSLYLAGGLVQRERAVSGWSDPNTYQQWALPDCSACGVAWGANHPAAMAWLVRREKRTIRVAVVGAGDPLLMRYLQADHLLEITPDTNDADVVIALGTEPPEGTAALVVAPRSAPSGWREGQPRDNVLLRDASVAADEPLMAGVDAASLAIRSARPWVALDASTGRPLVTLDGEALILRSEGSTPASSRRVWLEWDISAGNTNLLNTPAGVVFLANAMRWLAPGQGRKETFVTVRPIDAPWSPAWRPVYGGAPENVAVQPGLPWPGLYRDGPDGPLYGVSLKRLVPAGAIAPVSQQVARLALPSPDRPGMQGELWPIFAAGALLCWLGAWALPVLSRRRDATR